MQKFISDNQTPLTPEETLKLVGSLQALSKNMISNSENSTEDDQKFMHTAVAFCESIDKAEKLAQEFDEVQQKFTENLSETEKNSLVKVSADFVFGSRKVGKKFFFYVCHHSCGKIKLAEKCSAR